MKLFYLLAFLFCLGCNADQTQFEIRDIPLQSVSVMETPNWVRSPQNKLLLSWTQHEGDTAFTLKYAVWQDSSWSESRTIAQGRDWFVNWADFPSISIFPGSELNLLAHFLEKRAGGSVYDYDIKLALSNNSGQGFRILDRLHDTVAAEHGFVSLLPFSYDKILATWLDGGQMKESAEEQHSGHGHGGGSMQLRSALVDVSGQVKNNVLLDEKVCECCQTDAAMTGKGPVIVYRNRDDQEYRDIYCTRYISGQWTLPQPVFEDHWKIEGCPVNGPAVASINNQVAVAWYTEAGHLPSVKLCFSIDAGETFGPPVVLSTNTLGRVDITWVDESKLAISYLEKNPATDFKTAKIKLLLMSGQGKVISNLDVDETSSKRKTGFPVLETLDRKLYLAYTRILDSVKTDLAIKEIKLL